ncbi:ATP-binding protein [Planctomycetota bacterium]
MSQNSWGVAPWFRSLQAKLVGIFLALALAFLTATTYLFYKTTRNLILTSVRSHLQSVVDEKSDLIEWWMGEREHDVEVLAKNATVREYMSGLAGVPTNGDGGREALRSLLRLTRNQYGAYHEIGLFDRDGNPIVSTNEAPSLPSGSQSLTLAAMRSGRTCVSEAYRRAGGSSRSLDIVVPVESSAGQFLAAVVACVDVGIVNQMTDAARLMPSGEAYLVDRRGVLVTQRDRRRVLRDDLSHVPGVSNVIGGMNGVDEYPNYRGVPVVGAYRWLPRWRWGLIAEVGQHGAFVSVLEARRNLLLIGGVITVAVCLAIFLVARRIVQPLRKLTRAVQAVASGQLDQQLTIAGHDEVAHLTTCFNEMASNLAESRSAFDERIEQATSSLEKKNEELRLTNERMAEANAELQQANRELERQRALVARSATLAAMGEMAAGIAHEINNPLTTMKNIVYSLRGGMSEADIRQRDMAIVAEEVDRITKLVRRLLRFAQPSKPNPTWLDLRVLLQRTLDLAAPQARQKEIAVNFDAEDNLPEIHGDGEQLGQVFLNLLLNAIQASPRASQIRVFARTVFSEGADGQRKVEVGVRDEGPGIPSGDRQRIFAPFFSTKSNGTGLGLSISQRIAEEHGGEVSFYCGSEKGTTFVVSLSRQTEGQHEPDPHS